MRIHYLVFTVLLMSFLSCKENKSKEVEKESVVRVKDKYASFPKDMFYAKEECVLFLRPSDELFKMYEENEEEGLYEVDSDFGYYANEFYKEQKDKRKIYFVTQRVIALINSKADTVLIDRYNKDLIYGVVIQQNDSIQILKGVNTDIDVKMALGIFNHNEIR